jgi:hypothetical protein
MSEMRIDSSKTIVLLVDTSFFSQSNENISSQTLDNFFLIKQEEHGYIKFTFNSSYHNNQTQPVFNYTHVGSTV